MSGAVVFAVMLCGTAIIYALYSIFKTYNPPKGKHKWRYRNPAARKCIRCGRVENLYEGVGCGPSGTWEIMSCVWDQSICYKESEE